jgi:hypothetical protein
MVTVVGRSPVRSADIAELITTAASHVVATLILLNHKFATFALSVVEVVLEELYLMLVTQSIVLCQQTLTAELRFTSVANHNSFGDV